MDIGIIIDHQEAFSEFSGALIPRQVRGFGSGRRLHFHRKGQRKRRTFGQLALDGHRSVHHLGEMLGNGQSQSRPSVLAGCGGLPLRECFKQFLELLLRHPNALIHHNKADG